LPIISFSIYYVFFVNFGTIFWMHFPDGNEGEEFKYGGKLI